MSVSTKTNVLIDCFKKLAVCSLSKKRQFLRKMFCRKYFRIHNIAPSCAEITFLASFKKKSLRQIFFGLAEDFKLVFFECSEKTQN
jgi:hypothetical protein